MDTNSKETQFKDLPGYRWIPNGQSNLSGEIFELFKTLDSMFLRLASRVQAKEFYLSTQ